MSKPVPKTALTPDERAAIEALQGVTFRVASWDKRFARDVLFPALDSGELGQKSRPQLWRIFIRYRRQIRCSPADHFRLLQVAHTLSAPDFRKENAAAREQARIDEMKRKYEESLHGLNPAAAVAAKRQEKQTMPLDAPEMHL
jgi:hypothetical protein